MTMHGTAPARSGEDPVGNVLKWILLAVAIATFAVLGWTTKLTYRAAPPQPDRLVAPDGTTVMSAGDQVAGKAGFQRADLMDSGSRPVGRPGTSRSSRRRSSRVSPRVSTRG